MYLQKKKNISNTSKFTKLPIQINLKNPIHCFFLKKKNIKIKTNFLKKTIIFSKLKKFYLTYNFNSNIFWTKQTSLIINFKQIFLKSSFLIIKSINGSISLIKNIFGLFIGDYLHFFFFFFNQYKYKYIGWQTMLKFLPKFLFISNLKVFYFSFSYYSTTNGTYTQIIEIFKDINLIKIKLPSGKKKIISDKTLSTLGRNNNIFHKFIFLGSYKLNKYLGKKFNVRGVAMNPVDHPHGGRTKTNKPEVSPWNWVTKYSH